MAWFAHTTSGRVRSAMASIAGDAHGARCYRRTMAKSASAVICDRPSVVPSTTEAGQANAPGALASRGRSASDQGLRFRPSSRGARRLRLRLRLPLEPEHAALVPQALEAAERRQRAEGVPKATEQRRGGTTDHPRSRRHTVARAVVRGTRAFSSAAATRGASDGRSQAHAVLLPELRPRGPPFFIWLSLPTSFVPAPDGATT